MEDCRIEEVWLLLDGGGRQLVRCEQFTYQSVKTM